MVQRIILNPFAIEPKLKKDEATKKLSFFFLLNVSNQFFYTHSNLRTLASVLVHAVCDWVRQNAAVVNGNTNHLPNELKTKPGNPLKACKFIQFVNFSG